MNGTVISFQWCIEIINKRSGELEDSIFESQLSAFESRMKILKKGELCLVRTESEEGAVKNMLWSYTEEKNRLCEFKDAIGKISEVEVPERFVVELQRFMNKTRTHTPGKKRVEEADNNFTRSLPKKYTVNDTQKKMISREPCAGKIPVRINHKTILYLDKNLNATEINLIIQKYNK